MLLFARYSVESNRQESAVAAVPSVLEIDAEWAGLASCPDLSSQLASVAIVEEGGKPASGVEPVGNPADPFPLRGPFDSTLVVVAAAAVAAAAAAHAAQRSGFACLQRFSAVGP